MRGLISHSRLVAVWRFACSVMQAIFSNANVFKRIGCAAQAEPTAGQGGDAQPQEQLHGDLHAQARRARGVLLLQPPARLQELLPQQRHRFGAVTPAGAIAGTARARWLGSLAGRLSALCPRPVCPGSNGTAIFAKYFFGDA